MQSPDVPTVFPADGPFQRTWLGLSGVRRSAIRVILGAELGLLILAVLAAFIDPAAPPGCPGSAVIGQDCARYGFLGRVYAAHMQVLANKAATPQEALADGDQAIALRPNFIFAYNTRGNAYAAIGKTDEALKAYGRALELAPGYVGARANRAVLYQQIGRPTDAARDFKAVYDSPLDSHRRAEVVDFAKASDRTTHGPLGR